MRLILLTALALLAACAPPAPPASPPPAAPAEAGPLAAQLDAATAAIGRWSYRGDEGVTSACFGAPESECQLSIQCEAPTQTLTIIVDAELTPDQDALIQIYDAQGSMTVFSRSHNEGLPSVIAEIGPDSLDRLGLLELLSAAPALRRRNPRAQRPSRRSRRLFMGRQHHPRPHRLPLTPQTRTP